jgi:hypothetical protein
MPLTGLGAYILGAYSLGANNPGANNLHLPISGQVKHSTVRTNMALTGLRAYSLGAYSLGSTIWGPTISIYRFRAKSSIHPFERRIIEDPLA